MAWLKLNMVKSPQCTGIHRHRILDIIRVYQYQYKEGRDICMLANPTSNE
jgi:hypothetical protein